METGNVIEDFMKNIPQEVLERASRIKLLITDVDGVLTDGGIIYDNSGMELKKFNVKDGLGVKLLKKHKILVGAITGRASRVVENRLEELGFDFHYHGVKNKGHRLDEVLKTLELKKQEVAYIGDDLIDLPILSQVGLAVAPSDAIEYLKPHATLITKAKGGRGVFREVSDIILHSQGKLESIIESYQNQ